ncbi:PREDICTED: uncharacterized protein LOC109337590, partial [Lupinus angustifolius]|uniref:uncharacterized protein LOC109337590 n=1 Tax=Lupinus angustifolius TaxID=3871 RepID=UPI00092E8EC5
MQFLITAAVVLAVTTIWHYRNLSRFQDKKLLLPQAINRTKSSLTLAGNSSSAIASSSLLDSLIIRSLKVQVNYRKSPRILEVNWKLPPFGRVKINTDGAARGHPGHAGGGGIFRDHNGLFMGAFSTYFGIHDALYAEISSAFLAIQQAHSMGWHTI